MPQSLPQTRRSVWLELVVPAYLVIILPLLVLWLDGNRAAFFDVFINSVTCFALSLFVFQLYFWSVTGKYGPDQLRYIDYIYLSAATLGLFGAANLPVKTYDTEVTQAINQARNFIQLSEREYSNNQTAICLLPSNNNDCALLKILLDESERAIVTLETQPSIDNLSVVVKKLSSIEDEIVYKPENIRHAEDSYRNLLWLSQRLQIFY